MQHIRAQRFNVKKIPDGKRKIRKSVALELEKDGKNAISFGTNNPLNIGENIGIEVVADEAPIQLIKGLQWVAFKQDSSGAVDLGDFSLEKVAKNNTKSLATTLLGNLEIPDKKLPPNSYNYTSIEPCKALDRGGMYKEGGRSCSKAVYGATDAPVTFFLKTKVKSPVGPGTSLPKWPVTNPDGIIQIKHFLIPTIMKGSTVVWVAVPEGQSQDDTREKLSKWQRSVFRVAGFSGLLFTSDDLEGISITFDAEPIG
jgi:hypothetical protein